MYEEQDEADLEFFHSNIYYVPFEQIQLISLNGHSISGKLYIRNENLSALNFRILTPKSTRICVFPKYGYVGPSDIKRVLISLKPSNDITDMNFFKRNYQILIQVSESSVANKADIKRLFNQDRRFNKSLRLWNKKVAQRPRFPRPEKYEDKGFSDGSDNLAAKYSEFMSEKYKSTTPYANFERGKDSIDSRSSENKKTIHSHAGHSKYDKNTPEPHHHAPIQHTPEAHNTGMPNKPERSHVDEAHHRSSLPYISEKSQTEETSYGGTQSTKDDTTHSIQTSLPINRLPKADRISPQSLHPPNNLTKADRTLSPPSIYAPNYITKADRTLTPQSIYAPNHLPKADRTGSPQGVHGVNQITKTDRTQSPERSEKSEKFKESMDTKKKIRPPPSYVKNALSPLNIQRILNAQNGKKASKPKSKQMKNVPADKTSYAFPDQNNTTKSRDSASSQKNSVASYKTPVFDSQDDKISQVTNTMSLNKQSLSYKPNSIIDTNKMSRSSMQSNPAIRASVGSAFKISYSFTKTSEKTSNESDHDENIMQPVKHKEKAERYTGYQSGAEFDDLTLYQPIKMKQRNKKKKKKGIKRYKGGQRPVICKRPLEEYQLEERKDPAEEKKTLLKFQDIVSIKDHPTYGGDEESFHRETNSKRCTGPNVRRRLSDVLLDLLKTRNKINNPNSIMFKPTRDYFFRSDICKSTKKNPIEYSESRAENIVSTIGIMKYQKKALKEDIATKYDLPILCGLRCPPLTLNNNSGRKKIDETTTESTTTKLYRPTNSIKSDNNNVQRSMSNNEIKLLQNGSSKDTLLTSIPSNNDEGIEYDSKISLLSRKHSVSKNTRILSRGYDYMISNLHKNPLVMHPITLTRDYGYTPPGLDLRPNMIKCNIDACDIFKVNCDYMHKNPIIKGYVHKAHKLPNGYTVKNLEMNFMEPQNFEETASPVETSIYKQNQMKDETDKTVT